MKSRRVLVGCEFSGIVRDAFLKLGHDAISCDLLPTEKPGPHYQGDIRDILYNGYDIGVFHPPCTHLCVSGARWFKQKGRALQEESLAFVKLLMDALMRFEDVLYSLHHFEEIRRKLWDADESIRQFTSQKGGLWPTFALTMDDLLAEDWEIVEKAGGTPP